MVCWTYPYAGANQHSHRDQQEQDEQHDVESKDDVGDYMQTIELVRQIEEEDGGDAGPHVDGKPARCKVQYPPPPLMLDGFD